MSLLSNPRLRMLGIVLVCVAALVALDRVIYSRLLFGLPNYSGWDSFRWYNFEYHLRRLKREAAEAEGEPSRARVLVVGSSIAKYSVQSELLEGELAEQGVAAKVDLAVHAAMMPTDLYYYRERLLAARPDLVVYITNPADLDLERYLPPWEAGGGYSDASMEEYLSIRHPMLYYYPAAFAREHGRRLGSGQVARLLLRDWFYSLRYKDEWRPLLRFKGQVEDGRLRSYLNYQGAPVTEGLWRDGWTGACFSLKTEWLDEERGLYLQILPELRARPDFRLEFFQARDHREARDCVANDAPYAALRFDRSGWQQVEIPLPGYVAGPVFVRLSHVWNADAAPGAEDRVAPVVPEAKVWAGRGVRLPGRLGRKDVTEDDYYRRMSGLEDDRLAAMSDRRYEADFRARVHPLEWREGRYRALRQFNKLRLSKYYTNYYPWNEIYQARELRRFVAALRERGVGVLLINNAENPLTRAAYENNDWYRGYVAYLQELADGDPGVTFADLRDRAIMQHFVDAHHLTYHGVREMRGAYARSIARALKP